jgi:hypothetical protein
MTHRLQFSNLRLLATKDGDSDGPGEINFILFLDDLELTRSTWGWPIYDGNSRNWYNFDFDTDKTNFKIRLDVHEEDDWPEANDFARSEISLDILENWGYSNWDVRAVSNNQKLDCTLTFDLRVVAPLPVPEVVTAYEHVDTRGISTSLMSSAIRTESVENNKVIHLYKFNFFNGGIENDSISSIYVPRGDFQITVFENTPNDPNFVGGGKLQLPYSPFASAHIVNLPKFNYSNTNGNCNDSVSYIEIRHTTNLPVPKVKFTPDKDVTGVFKPFKPKKFP